MEPYRFCEPGPDEVDAQVVMPLQIGQKDSYSLLYLRKAEMLAKI